MRRMSVLAAAAAVLLVSGGCASDGGPAGPGPLGSEIPGTVTRQGDVVSGTGTVRWYSFEGGFHAIAGDDGKLYDPINLPAEFRQDGVPVRFRARLRPDLMSFHMAGHIVEVQEIARR